MRFPRAFQSQLYSALNTYSLPVSDTSSLTYYTLLPVFTFTLQFTHTHTHTHFKCTYLEIRVAVREGMRDRDFHLLVHSTDGCESQGWARLKRQSWLQGPKHLDHLPSLPLSRPLSLALCIFTFQMNISIFFSKANF